MLSRTGGETFCIYKTPCGFCSRLNRDCTEDCSPKTRKHTNKTSEEKILNPAGEYAVKFAHNHGISLSKAMEEPMVKARFHVFEEIGY